VNKVLTINIPISNIETGVFTPRRDFSLRYIEGLAYSIKIEGQLKPIIVRPHPSKEDWYQCIDGECRIRACKKLGKVLIRAEIRMLSDEEADYLAMRINQLHGKRLNELEEALHIQRMMEKYGLSQNDIAKKFKKSQQWVSMRLALVTALHPEIQKNVTTRVVTSSHARELAELPKEEQPRVLQKIIDEKLSFRETEALVHALKEASLEKKEEILRQPISSLTPPPKDEYTSDVFECPRCGCKVWIDFIKKTVTWEGVNEPSVG